MSNNEPREATQFAVTRTTEVPVVRVIAYPDEVTIHQIEDDFVLTPDEALELASALVSAANEANGIKWAPESDENVDGLLVVGK